MFFFVDSLCQGFFRQVNAPEAAFTVLFPESFHNRAVLKAMQGRVLVEALAFPPPAGKPESTG